MKCKLFLVLRVTILLINCCYASEETASPSCHRLFRIDELVEHVMHQCNLFELMPLHLVSQQFNRLARHVLYLDHHWKRPQEGLYDHESFQLNLDYDPLYRLYDRASDQGCSDLMHRIDRLFNRYLYEPCFTPTFIRAQSNRQFRRLEGHLTKQDYKALLYYCRWQQSLGWTHVSAYQIINMFWEVRELVGIVVSRMPWIVDRALVKRAIWQAGKTTEEMDYVAIFIKALGDPELDQVFAAMRQVVEDPGRSASWILARSILATETSCVIAGWLNHNQICIQD